MAQDTGAKKFNVQTTPKWAATLLLHVYGNRQSTSRQPKAQGS